MKHSRRNVYPDPNSKGWCWKLDRQKGAALTRREACEAYIAILIATDSTARELLGSKSPEDRLRMLELD